MKPSQQKPESTAQVGGDYPHAAPIMVWVTLLLFLAMIILLGYRWLKMAEPNGFIQVNGDKAFVGDEVSVKDTASHVSSNVELTAPNEYSAHFPLPQGTYQISLLKNGELVWEKSVVLPEAAGMIYTLDPKMTPTTKP